jgi:hypothetical protein
VQKEVAPGDAPVLAGKKLASLVGRDVSDQQAAKIGSVVYWALGMSYGMAAAVLARAGVPPLVAGIATGAMALVVDGGVMSAFFTPPPLAYPLDSHVRELVGHLGYGAVAGTMLSAVRGLGTRGC